MFGVRNVAAVSLVVVVISGLSGAGSGRASDTATQSDAQAFEPAAVKFFREKVRPLLEARCYECHSASAKRLEGGLRLDARPLVLKGGDSGPAAVPGKPAESVLVQAINYQSFEMPPRGRLPQGEIDILTKWVQLGLPWADGGLETQIDEKKLDIDARKKAHWAWQPIKSHSPPAVRDTHWPLGDIDRFILQKLEAQGLRPANPADRRTLIRRASFDLTGLPPTRQEVDAFLQDPDPAQTAFRKLVDRLLDSPHFGERWARHWLDLVRYGETLGHEFDYPLRNAYRYRDYVIRAFNADVPYDRFLMEHVAGDLLTPPRLHPTEGYNESIIGTGFWFLGELKHAPVDVKAEEAAVIDNQIDVFSKTFLALTVSCARCHDHKYDAISARDYYALAGYLQSSRRQQAFLDPHSKIQTEAGQLKKIHAEATTRLRAAVNQLQVDDLYRRLMGVRDVLLGSSDPKDAGRERRVAQVATERQLNPGTLSRWIQALSSESLKSPSHPLFAWRELVGMDDKSFRAARTKLRNHLAHLTRQRAELERKSELVADFNDAQFEGWFPTGWAFGDGPLQKLEWTRGVESRHPGVAHSGRFGNALRGVLRSSTFTLTKPTLLYRIAGEGATVRLIIDGYVMDEFSGLLFGGCKFDVSDGKWQWRRQAGDVGRYLGHRCHIELIDDGNGWLAIDEIRQADADAPTPELVSDFHQALLADDAIASHEAFTKRVAEAIVSATNDESSAAAWLVNAGLSPDHTIASELDSALQRAAESEQSIPEPQYALGITDGSGEDECLFIRGSHRNLGPVVPRRMLAATDGEEQPAPSNGSGRLELAQRLLDPANPFPARVMVNRIWQHLFGRGLVESVDNFGVLGKPPSHPELLDFLATQFVADGWSVKRLIRSLMLTRTYQMESQVLPEAEERDPQNTWWHRMPIRRLEGEAIRDAMLTVSGRLDRTVEGPSVPVYLTPFMQGRGRPSSGPLDGNGRRSIYVSVNRNFLSPLMLAFDTPIPFTTVGRRNTSNVPAQALILLNDPFVIEQSRTWARRVLSDTPQEPQLRIRRLYLDAFTRDVTDDEVREAVAFLQQQATAAGYGADWQTDERVWADLCHVLFNVKEFVFVK